MATFLVAFLFHNAPPKGMWEFQTCANNRILDPILQVARVGALKIPYWSLPLVFQSDP